MDKFELLELALRDTNPGWLGPLEILLDGLPPDVRVPLPQMAELTLLGSVIQRANPDFEEVWLGGMNPAFFQATLEAQVFYLTALGSKQMLKRFEPALKTLGWEAVTHDPVVLSGFVQPEVLEMYRAGGLDSGHRRV